MDYTKRAVIYLFTLFFHICCDLRTFVVMPEMSRFTRFGSQKKSLNLGLRAKKTEFAALPIKESHRHISCRITFTEFDTPGIPIALRESICQNLDDNVMLYFRFLHTSQMDVSAHRRFTDGHPAVAQLHVGLP